MENLESNQNAVEITPAIDQNLDIQSLIEKSAKLGELKPIITLTAEYIELEKPGEHFDGVYIGIQEMKLNDQNTGEQKTLQAARFLVDKQVKINAGAVLINEIERAKISVGTPLRVTYLRKDGNAKLYTLTLLG